MGLDETSDAHKIALLLTAAGRQSMELLDSNCSLIKNETFERYIFCSHLQQQADTFDSFLIDLMLKARTCNFGLLQDSMIRDQIVFGINDKKVRERFLRETELTLNEAVWICHASAKDF